MINHIDPIVLSATSLSVDVAQAQVRTSELSDRSGLCANAEGHLRRKGDLRRIPMPCGVVHVARRFKRKKRRY